MGKIEFYAWVSYLQRQREAQEVTPDSWRGADSDPGWQRLRESRDKARGRR